VIGGLITPKSPQDAGPRILVVGDVDFLADTFYATANAEAADNAAFLLNAVDIMSGSPQLVGLRSRAPAMRPLVVVERIKREAQERLLSEQSQLEARLKMAQDRLASLESTRKGLSADQASGEVAQIEEAQAREVRQEMLETRAKLRKVQLGERVDIDRIKSMLILINAVIMPFCVALVGGLVFAFQRRKQRLALRQNGQRSSP
jgi:ABC-2 type transport system permease protein